MLTAVVSDLHLGSRMTALATPPVRERLIDELAGADRIVLLGDLLSLRDAPVADVLRAADLFLAALREVAAGRPVVVVPGNHDHRLARPVLESGPTAELGLEQVAAPGSDGVAGALARRLEGVSLEIAYPGLWIRPDVYATHGHYLDCHMTVPRLECLLAAAGTAAVGRPPGRGATPADYEAALAPLYDFAYEYAQARRARGDGGDRAMLARFRDFGWRRMSGRRGGHGLVASAATGLAAAGTLAAMNLAGLGPFRLDLSPDAISRAGLDAARELVRRLGIDAPHVVLGHTHRADPGPALVNCGSWIYEEGLIGPDGPADPYWPGRCVLVRDDGAPELRHLLHEPAPALAAA